MPLYLGRATDGVLGKRSHDGEIVGILVSESTESSTVLRIPFPTTGEEGDVVYDDVTIETAALFSGREEAIERARGDGPDQTCGETMRTVATRVLNSVSVLEPVEVETALSLSPSSPSVRRGERVELTVEATGVDWVDVQIGSDETDFQLVGAVRVDDGTVPLSVGPPTDESYRNLVTTPDDTTLNIRSASGEFVSGSYPVTIAAPGNDGLVTESVTLSVEPSA